MGKWSKKAREMHSVRMKERFAARKAAASIVNVSTEKATIKDALESIINAAEYIKKQLGE